MFSYYIKASSLIKQCAVSLCGSPQDVPSPMLFDSNIEKLVQKKDMNKFSKIEPKLKALIEMKLNDNDRFIQAVKQRFQRPFQLQFESWDELDYYELSWMFFDPYITFVSNVNNSFHQRLSYFIMVPDHMNPITQQGIHSYAVRRKSLTENSYTLGLREGFYNIEEALSIFQNNWETFFLRYQEYRNNNPVFTHNLESAIENLMQRIHKNDIKTFSALLQLSEDLERISGQFKAFTSQNAFIGPSRDFYYLCKDISCKNAIRQEIQKHNFEVLIKEFEQVNKRKGQLAKEKLTYCKSYFASHVIEYDESPQLKELIDEVTQSFLSRILEVVDTQLAFFLENYFNENISFSLQSNIKNSQEFLHTVERKYNEITMEPLEDYFSYSEAELVKKLLDYYDKETDTMNPLKRLNICPNSLSSILSDKFISKDKAAEMETVLNIDLENSKDNIIISHFTQSYPNYAKGIIAHELSHALSSLVINSEPALQDYFPKFLELRECAKSWHPTRRDSEFNITGYHDEDTADLLSYLATYDEPRLYSCSLLGRSFDGNSYSDITETLHSSRLLRVLREAVHKKRLIPPSCQELMNQNQEDFNIKACF